MVKLFAFLTRRNDLTHDEFVHHWRDRHGPMIANEPTIARHVVRYLQHPRCDAGPLSGSSECDGVAEQWFESMDAFTAFLREPAYAALVAPDEARFLDRQTLRFVVCSDPVVMIDRVGRSTS